MVEPQYLAFVPAATLFGGALLIMVRGHTLGRRLKESIALFAVVAAFVALDRLATLPRPFTVSLGEWVPLPSSHLSLDFNLYVDGTAILFCMVLLLVAQAILIASTLAQSPALGAAQAMGLFLGALGSLALIFFSGNLILLYLAWQLLILFALFFISQGSPLRSASSHPFLVVAHLCGLALLLSALLLGQDPGGYDLAPSRAYLTTPAAVLLAVIAAASLAAQYPWHAWLPPLAMGGNGMLALLLLPLAGVYLVARLADPTGSWNPQSGTILMVVGALSSLVLAFLAFAETDWRRALAYVGASQVGLAFLGLGLGTPLGRAGALTQMASLPLALLLVLICLTPEVERTVARAASSRLKPPGSLVRNGLLLLAGASLLGLPSPSGGFIARWMLHRAALEAGDLALVAAMMVAALLIVTPLLRAFREVSAPFPSGHLTALTLPTLLLVASAFLPWLPLPGLRLTPADISPLAPGGEGSAVPLSAWLGLGLTVLVVAGPWLPRPGRPLSYLLDLATPLGWLAGRGLVLAELAERGMAVAEGHPYMAAILTSSLLVLLLMAG